MVLPQARPAQDLPVGGGLHHRRCPLRLDEPSKTATQCRHKIEKLRKWYRSEFQKPYLNSWHYFELMDQMERGPIPLDPRPITSFPNRNTNHNVANFSSLYSNSADFNQNSNHNVGNFSSLYSNSADFYHNDGGDSGVSDESDEKWRNKSKSINNIVRGGKGGGGRNFGNGGFSEDDDNNDDSDGDAAEEAEAGGSGGGGRGMELAAEIRGFTERFMGMETRKIEMMQEMQRCRMEMERKRMEMIAEAQRKMVDTIGRAFGANKRAKVDREC